MKHKENPGRGKRPRKKVMPRPILAGEKKHEFTETFTLLLGVRSEKISRRESLQAKLRNLSGPAQPALMRDVSHALSDCAEIDRILLDRIALVRKHYKIDPETEKFLAQKEREIKE